MEVFVQDFPVIEKTKGCKCFSAEYGCHCNVCKRWFIV